MALAISYQGLAALQVVLRDLTRRNLAEEAVRRWEVHLRQVDKLRALVNLAGGQGHDFKIVLMASLVLVGAWPGPS